MPGFAQRTRTRHAHALAHAAWSQQLVTRIGEAGVADVTKMVDFIKEQKVKAIFVESSVNPDAIERIAQDAGVVVGGELFSDAMGERGKMEHGLDVGTYEGMIKHNLNTIVNALK